MPQAMHIVSSTQQSEKPPVALFYHFNRDPLLKALIRLPMAGVTCAAAGALVIPSKRKTNLTIDLVSSVIK